MNPNLIYLVQTDTTVGFSSLDDEKLSLAKKRDKSKKILQTVDSYKTLKKYTRIPKKFRREVRYAKKTTFIYPNLKSFRVIEKNDYFFNFLKKFKTLYSTSANLTNHKFDEDFSCATCDVVVKNKKGFCETTASKIIKLSKTSKLKIR